MGGSGYGHWLRCDSKDTTESQHRIDIRRLKKWGSLQSGMAGTLSWSTGGEQTGSIGYHVETSRMVLNYRHRSNGGEWEDVRQIIYFDRTQCNYGGQRMWFLCPRCRKRVAILYGAGKYFYCRHCYNLTYACQKESLPFRLTRKSQKIRKRLGASLCTDEPIFKKPKGMHWKTFNKLKREADKASAIAWEIIYQQFGMKFF